VDEPPSDVTTEALWELLGARLRSYFLRRVSDEQVADELVQETFLRIHRGLDGVDDEERLTAWVFRVARNLVVDHRRGSARLPGSDAEAPEPAGDPDGCGPCG
jgi:RNA polymerase sigma-70 factor (ECF subfamily)